tara:strand:+ start:641 stop:757 length:117 start_codon:yes stop_codon:yes gene_type:complete
MAGAYLTFYEVETFAAQASGSNAGFSNSASAKTAAYHI